MRGLFGRPAFFNDPWSGFYQLGAPFYTQAQFTQFTEVGWRYIDAASGQNCGTPLDCTLTYATLAAPDLAHFTLVAINSGNDTLSLPLELAGGLTKFQGKPLQVWRSTETAYFARQADFAIGGGVGALGGGGGGGAGPSTLSLAPMSVTTLSSRPGAGWANYTVPPRARFQIPQVLPWDTQPVDAPCRGLSPIYGSFEAAESPDGDGQIVCRQAVPQNPGGNAWTHRVNGYPIALLPSGTNYANVDISVSAQIQGGLGDVFAVTLCGRVPMYVGHAFDALASGTPALRRRSNGQ